MIQDLRLRLEHSEADRSLLSAKLNFTSPSLRYENSQGHALWTTERASLEARIRLLENAAQEACERETKLTGTVHDLNIKLAAQQTDYERLQADWDKGRAAREWDKSGAASIAYGVPSHHTRPLCEPILVSSSTDATTSEPQPKNTQPSPCKCTLTERPAEITGLLKEAPIKVCRGVDTREAVEDQKNMEAEAAGLRIARGLARELEEAMTLGATLRRRIQEKDEVLNHTEDERKKAEDSLAERQEKLEETDRLLVVQRRELEEVKRLLETRTRELEDLREEDFQMGQMVLKVTAKLLAAAGEPVPEGMDVF